MKIKTKLIISFCMIIIVPACLALFTLLGLRNYNKRNTFESVGIEGAENFSGNALALINNLTKEEFEEIKNIARNVPEKLKDRDYLNEMNTKLSDQAYLVIMNNKSVYYDGGIKSDELLESFKKIVEDGELQTVAYVDVDENALIKYTEFYFEDGSQGTAIVITETEGVFTGERTIIIQVAAAIIIILFLTAVMMILWIYQSMIAPIRKLQLAAENIKEGNLDFKLEAEGKDEISELCVTFEEMRQRLKDNAEEKINNEKENRALISNIAHDLKTPITAVKGYAEGIIDGVANTPEKVDKYIRTIYNKANEMDTLINELTLYTKFDTNRIPYNYAKINVQDYFNDCIDEVTMDLEAKHIGLAYYNFVDKDVIIIADAEQLKRVVNNIINNSVKYMDRQQGHVNIRIKDVGDFIQVEMEDNGKGIAQKDLPFIFDRFYRADASRNSATGGSGIGLSIVKKIIEDHGGKIWATSKEGIGTTMYFVIRKFQEVKINE